MPDSQRISRRALFVPLLVVAWLAALQRPAAGAGDTVAGSFQVGGKSYKLTHVYARRQPSMTDKSKTVLVVLMTDNEVPKSVVEDKYRLELTDLARQGKIHGVSVTIGSDNKPEGTGFTYAKEVDGAIVNRADQHTVAVSADAAKVEGKLSGQGSFGDATWKYDATVKAAIATASEGSSLTVARRTREGRRGTGPALSQNPAGVWIVMGSPTKSVGTPCSTAILLYAGTSVETSALNCER